MRKSFIRSVAHSDTAGFKVTYKRVTVKRLQSPFLMVFLLVNDKKVGKVYYQAGNLEFFGVV